MQTTMVQQNQIIEELRQKIEQLNQTIAENSDLKQRLDKLQNEQLKQKPAKKETGEFEIQTEGEVTDGPKLP
ncbi:MAG: hypothetical protein PG981_000609 [Wolbachia endosymbiont of Ctenocephalides orientis wCori]|nr:MAG: hypothetical protein PG981_000609 [Wolbachia endosymbiont of Ctenocephalides orientis wCori]